MYLFILFIYSGWPNYYTHFAFISRIKSTNIDNTCVLKILKIKGFQKYIKVNFYAFKFYILREFPK